VRLLDLGGPTPRRRVPAWNSQEPKPGWSVPHPAGLVQRAPGLRAGELAALRWMDTDLAAGVIRVERAWDPKAA
jgi:integrase